MNLFDVEASPSEQRLLLYFGHPNHSLDRAQIAKSCGIHPGTLSRLVCRLERRGLLKVERKKPNRQGRPSYSLIVPFPAEESA